MCRLALTIVFLFAFMMTTFGQKPKELTLEGQSIKLINRDYKLIDILDARKDKSDIGSVQTGLLNNRRPAVLNSFDKEISNLLSPCFDGTERQLIIRINTLKINEWTTATRETGIASLNITFIEKIEETIYREIYCTILSKKVNGMDVTARHPINIAETFKVAIFQFLRAAKNDQLTKVNIAPTGIKQYTPQPIPVRTLNTDLKIYEYYIDFLNDEPMDIDQAKVITQAGGLMVKQKGGTLTEIWGAQFNGALYIMMNKRLRRLEAGEDNYYMTLQDIDEGAVALYGGLFGVIGNSIALSNSPTYRFGINPMTGQLDLEHGEETPRSSVGQHKEQEISIIHIDPYVKKKDVFSITRDDGKAFDINKSQYISLPPTESTFQICHKTSGQCTNIAFPAKPVYVKVNYKKGEIIVDYQSPQVRKEFLQTMDSRNQIN